MDEGTLTKIAMLTDGKYYRASSTDAEIDEIAEILNGFDKKEFASRTYERLQERYQFFGFLVFLILFFEFFIGERRQQWTRIKVILNKRVFIFLLFIGSSANLALRADIKDHIRRGNVAIEKKDFSGARAEFESARIDAPEEPLIPYNIGTSYYLEGNLEEAKKQYEQALILAKRPEIKALINYNLGHVLFSMNQRDEAVEKFKECLRNNPGDVDAKYNIEYIKAGHTPPPQKQQSKDQQGDKGNDKDKSQSGSSESKKSDESKDGKKKEGDLSKENAEQILQMLQSQESDKMKDAKPITIPKSSKKRNEKDSGEDW
jgi:tetratricopeptide (TPR) repeat protein